MRKCKVCPEKDRTIEVLTEQLEWMRIQIGTPKLIRSQPENATFAEMERNFLTDEEENVKFLVETGKINDVQAEAILQEFGSMDPRSVLSQ